MGPSAPAEGGWPVRCPEESLDSVKNKVSGAQVIQYVGY